jgi:hypothetical protein
MNITHHKNGEIKTLEEEVSNTQLLYTVCLDCGKKVIGDSIHTCSPQLKTLTDEEINVVAILQDAEIVPLGHEIWKTGEEFNKYKKIVLATAKALRKAQEK